MGWKKIAIGVAVVAALAVAAAPLVQAQAPTTTGTDKSLFGGTWIVGRLTAMDGDTLTITVDDETWQVTIDDDTEIRLPGMADARVDDLAVDAQITVRGKVTTVGKMDASQVSTGGPGGRGGGPMGGPGGERGWRGVAPVQGEVVAIAADSIIIKTANGETTYALNENTRFGVTENRQATWEDIEVGATVMVGVGSAEGDPARFVGVAPADGAAPMMMGRGGRGGRGFGMGGGPVAVHVSGSVTAKDDASLAVETTEGTFTVQKTDDTQTVGEDGKALTWDEIEVGQMVVVMGQPDPAHPIRAHNIHVVPAAPEIND